MKSSMTRLLLTLLLIAFVPLTHAGVGDVYYCVPDRADSIRSDEGHKEEKLKKFTMKWLEGVVIRKGPDSAELSLPILFSSQETFTAGKTTSDKLHHFVFKNGRLLGVLSAFIGEPSLVLITNATCEKFD